MMKGRPGVLENGFLYLLRVPHRALGIEKDPGKKGWIIEMD
jgi:hypothetical protein